MFALLRPLEILRRLSFISRNGKTRWKYGKFHMFQSHTISGHVKIRVPRGLADAAKCTNPRPHWRVGSLVPSKLTELTVSCLTCGHYWKVVSIFFIFTPIWGRFPFWLIFFKGVETTKKIILAPFLVLKIVVYSRPLLILFPSVPIKVNWKHRGSSKSMAQLIFTWTKGCTWTTQKSMESFTFWHQCRQVDLLVPGTGFLSSGGKKGIGPFSFIVI